MIKDKVIAWAEKYNQPENVTTKAISRAEVCDVCEHKKDQLCGVCGCRLIRTAFDEKDNPCPLYKFNEPIPPKYYEETLV